MPYVNVAVAVAVVVVVVVSGFVRCMLQNVVSGGVVVENDAHFVENDVCIVADVVVGADEALIRGFHQLSS